MVRVAASVALALTACTTAPTPCLRDMPGPGAGCGIEGTWAGGSGRSAIAVTFTASTFTGTFGGASDSGSYTITGTIGCNATFAIDSASCDVASADAAVAYGTYGIAVGTDCRTMSLSAQSDPCAAREKILGGAELAKQQ